MTETTLVLHEVRKTFNRRTVLRNISVAVHGPGALAVTGRNGSGKSTLVRIIAGVMAPSSGRVDLTAGGAVIPPDVRYRSIGFVAPYLFLYDEFSARENMVLLETMRSGKRPETAWLDELLELVGLADRQHDRLGTFSSGMKQRMKYVYALLHRPSLLILDEPTANLDTAGYDMVKGVVERQKKRGIVIVATNETDEAEWCSQRIELQIG
jgi:heme exporter protein A